MEAAKAKNSFLKPKEIRTFARQLCRKADVFINNKEITGGCPQLFYLYW
jgi:hypothetical protein